MVASRRGLAAAALAAAVCAACGKGAGEERRAADPPAPEERAAVFEGRRPPAPPWLAELARRRDPARAGWETEAFALAVERRLDVFLGALVRDPAGAERALAAVASPGFEGLTRLVPEEPAPVFEDGWLAVHRGGARDARLLPPGEWARLERGLVARLQAAERRRFDRWVTGVAATAGGYDLELRLRFTLGRGGPGGAVEQLELACASRWRSGEGGPELVALELVDFEEARASSAALEELTRHALGDNAFFPAEILSGNDQYQGRRDRTSGLSFLGMHGCAVGDVDGDGLEDLYLCQPGGQANRLLVQQPDGRFLDAEDSGVSFLDNSRGALLLDLENDGDLDLAVATGPHVLLAFNDGAGRFDGIQPLRGSGQAEIYSLSAADPDGDGLLDLYACRYVKDGINGGVPTPYHEAHNGAENFFWRNEGERRFRLATDEVGLSAGNTRFSLASVWEDLDDDGDVDLYVVNDFGTNNLFRNDGGRFTDVAAERGATDMAAGMGATVSDVDLDGDVDVYVSNMFTPAGSRVSGQARFAEGRDASAYLRHARGNTLLLADGAGSFRDATLTARAAPGGWAWGALFLDLNNDGLEDLYVPNGFITGAREEDLESFFWREVVRLSPAAAGDASDAYREAWEGIRHLSQEEDLSWNGRERNYVYLNLGGGRFADVSSAAGGDYLDDSRVACAFDWDDDGGLDLWLRNRTGPRLRLLHNVHGARGHFLKVDLVGTSSNRDAVGARVRLELAGGRRLQQSVLCGEGYLGQSSRRLHFGLGRAARAESLTVRWPDGATERFEDLAADARYRIVQGEGTIQVVPARDRAALAPAVAEELYVPPGLRAERVVPAARLPVAKLRLPQYAGPARRVEELAGAPLLLVLWRPGHAGSEALAADLAARAGDFARTQTKIALLAASDEDGAARARLAELGLAGLAGRADRGLLLSLEILLVEILGPFESLPLPLALLLDGGGQLVVLYAAPGDADPILRDAARARYLDPDDASTTRLTGGRWIAQEGRGLKSLAAVFRRFGIVEEAEYYERLAGLR